MQGYQALLLCITHSTAVLHVLSRSQRLKGPCCLCQVQVQGACGLLCVGVLCCAVLFCALWLTCCLHHCDAQAPIRQ